MHRIEEGILAVLLGLQVLDFMEWLPGDVDFGKKILSWSALGYLMYKVNLCRILFGEKHNAHAMNGLIIVSYFLLIVKNLTGYAMVAEDAHLFSPLLQSIAENAFQLELASFYVGGSMLLLVSLYLAFTEKVGKPSLMHIIHEEGPPPKTASKFALRFLSVFLVLVSFFIVVFNLVMEWLAMAVDALLVMIALFFYMFIVVRHYRKFNAERFIYKVGEVGESFYDEFIELFHDKRRIFMGVSGMLVLHLLTDIANFVVPYMVSRKDALYFGSLAPHSHMSFAQLLAVDFATVNSPLVKAVIAWAYALNVVAVLMLMILPAYVWWKLYKRQGFKVSPLALSVFFASVSVLLISPVMGMSPIETTGEGELVGVDFTTQGVSGNALVAFIVSVALGMFAYFTAKSHWARRKLTLIAVVVMDALFALYIYFFFVSLWEYYTSAIVLLLRNSYFFIGSYMLMFFAVTIVFYVGGFLIFLLESRSEFGKI